MTVFVTGVCIMTVFVTDVCMLTFLCDRCVYDDCICD